MSQAAVRGERRARRTTARAARWARWLPRASAGLGITAALLWWAVHRYDWMGPLVANTLRSIVGVGAVAKLEDVVYAIEDRYNRLARGTEAPKSYWAVPSAPKCTNAPTVRSAPTRSAIRASFRPFCNERT